MSDNTRAMGDLGIFKPHQRGIFERPAEHPAHKGNVYYVEVPLAKLQLDSKEVLWNSAIKAAQEANLNAKTNEGNLKVISNINNPHVLQKVVSELSSPYKNNGEQTAIVAFQAEKNNDDPTVPTQNGRKAFFEPDFLSKEHICAIYLPDAAQVPSSVTSRTIGPAGKKCVEIAAPPKEFYEKNVASAKEEDTHHRPER
jgi:hypothetical protein